MNEFLAPPFTHANLDRYVVRTTILKALKTTVSKFQGRFLDVGSGNQPYRSLIESNSNIDEYVPLDLTDNWHYQDAEYTWDGTTMPFETSSFGSAMATEVLEHCPYPETTLREVSRVLEPGGLLFFTVPFVWPLHDCPHDEYRYTPWSLNRHLENSNFSDICLWPTGGWDSTFAQCIGLWIRRRPMSDIKRRVLSTILKPVMAKLIARDEVIKEFDNKSFFMPGIAGTARSAH